MGARPTKVQQDPIRLGGNLNVIIPVKQQDDLSAVGNPKSNGILPNLMTH